MRLFGQRSAPDSYIMGRMVAPTVTKLLGEPCFTTVNMQAIGPARGLPKGLDVLAVLGSDRARQILDSTGDSKHENYDETMVTLRKQFQDLPPSTWRQNLYWLWLGSLKTLALEDRGRGYQSFMNTAAWDDKQLNAALASWTALRHDTILYAKSSYTVFYRGMGPKTPEPEGPVVGYVEPVPHLYARMIALVRATAKGLDDLKVLSAGDRAGFQKMDGLFSRLLTISIKEVRNQALTQEEYDFIADFGNKLSPMVSGGAHKFGEETTLVADVHTDQNSRQTLEEGSGYLRLLCVAYKLPQGHILVGCGPSFSYYEFRWPMDKRLEDNGWRGLILSDQAPPLPEWTASFADFAPGSKPPPFDLKDPDQAVENVLIEVQEYEYILYRKPIASRLENYDPEKYLSRSYPAFSGKGENRVFQGYVIWTTPGDVCYYLGLQRGDVLTSINWMKLDEKDGIELINGLADYILTHDSLTLTVRRGNEVLDLRYKIE